MIHLAMEYTRNTFLQRSLGVLKKKKKQFCLSGNDSILKETGPCKRQKGESMGVVLL